MTMPKVVSLRASHLAQPEESLTWEEHQARYRKVARESASDFKEVLDQHGPGALRETVDELLKRRHELEESKDARRDQLDELDLDDETLEDIQEVLRRLQGSVAMLDVRHAVADAVLYQWLAFSRVDVEEIASAIVHAAERPPPIPPKVSPSPRAQEVCRAIASVTKERPEHLLDETQLKDLFQRVANELDGLDSENEEAWRSPYGILHEWTKRNLGSEYWTGDASGIAELAERLTEENERSV